MFSFSIFPCYFLDQQILIVNTLVFVCGGFEPAAYPTLLPLTTTKPILYPSIFPLLIVILCTD